MCHDNYGHRGWAGAGRGFDPGVMGWFWGGGGPRGRRGGGFKGGRMFEQGDLKYVILKLLEEKPRHGYEIIKELEDRFRGAYAPSPGTVYPTLTMLEDLGYARAQQEEGGKRIYEITPEGRAYLADNKSTVEDIFERIADFGTSFFGPAMTDVNRSFKDLARATYTIAWRTTADADKMRRIREALDRARKEIEELAGSAGSGPASAGSAG
ncbi:MAG TPA: PadR family transcriptional regulator [Gemmatimonadaceae bacterium]|nr:PadR family transcriptional regulator [Gemmatimonadaceae bacterium]